MTGHNVRYVLGFGLAAVVVAFVIVYIAYVGLIRHRVATRQRALIAAQMWVYRVRNMDLIADDIGGFDMAGKQNNDIPRAAT